MRIESNNGSPKIHEITREEIDIETFRIKETEMKFLDIFLRIIVAFP